jgi:hypothetical protein
LREGVSILSSLPSSKIYYINYFKATNPAHSALNGNCSRIEFYPFYGLVSHIVERNIAHLAAWKPCKGTTVEHQVSNPSSGYSHLSCFVCVVNALVQVCSTIIISNLRFCSLD